MTRYVSNPSAAFSTIWAVVVSVVYRHIERTGQTHLALGGTLHGGQPTTLARIHEHKHGVVRIEQRLELFDVLCACTTDAGGIGCPGMGIES